MTQPEELSVILERIAKGEDTEADRQTLQDLLNQGDRPPPVLQVGKYAVNIQQALGQVHIGDRLELTEENIQSIAQAIRAEISKSVPSQQTEVVSVDELVQQVRSHLHDGIQHLHGTMPLWGVDHWVPLGELFVDVNILEELSSSRRSELDDLWQDFSKNPSYRSLDRIGLGRESQRVSGLEVLAKHTNLMIVGKPGSGKTTYLQRVVTECNAGNLQAHKIPVLIRLREFMDDGRDIAYSLERYLERCWQLSAIETQLVLNQGQSLVLLDGLDEVMGEDGKTITKQIKQFARAYPQVQMIVTCRTQSFSGEMDWKSLRFSFVEVADFNELQVRSFTEHWFQTVMQDKHVALASSREFLEQLFPEENQAIRELAITPILLSLTCTVFRQTGKFYSKRSKLYEEGLELLLEQWDRSREIERDEIYRDLSVERKLELLSYLAAKKFEQEQYVLFEQAEIEGYIAKFLGIGLRESRAVLRAIGSQHGLLVERSRQVWSFSHLTFQEYFAAKFFCNRGNWQELSSHIAEKHWQQAILLSVEMAYNAEKLLVLIKKEIDLLLINCKEAQSFLNWVNQKSILSNFISEQMFVRAFYFTLGLHFSFVRSLSSYPDHSLNPAYHLDEFACSLELDFRSAFPSYSIKDEDRTEIIKYAHSLQFAISQNIPIELKFLLEKLRDEPPDSNEAFIKRKVLERKTNREIEPYPEELAFETWWKTSGQSWLERLRTVMIKYCNIGHKWEFNDICKNKLELYYDTNMLLIDCIEISYTVRPELKEEIKETLLLPIAEIEKRRREKVE